MKTLLLAVWTLFALCGFACAEIAATQPSAFDAFITNTVQPLVLSLLGVIVAGAVTYLTNLLKKKFGLEISNATQERIRTVAFDAVHAAEEKGAAYLKEKGEKRASESKYNDAINFVLAKVPTLSREEADEKIHAALAMVKGLGASKATGN